MTHPVALAVVAYRDPGALEALLATAIGFDEVMVANVTDDPGVRAVIEAGGAAGLPIEGNPGFATAVNLLARECRSPWILVTNDDVVLRAGVAQACRDAQGAEPVIGPALTRQDGTRQHSVRAIPTPLRFVLEWVLLPDRGPSWLPVAKWRIPRTRTRVVAVTAAALLVERTLLVTRPMPEDYVMYWEELDWFWRLRDEGVAVVVDPSIVITRPDGRDERGEAKWERMGANLVRLGRHRWGRAGAVGYFALCCAWLARLALTDSVAADRFGRWRARRAALAGAWAGVRRTT